MAGSWGITSTIFVFDFARLSFRVKLVLTFCNFEPSADFELFSEVRLLSRRLCRLVELSAEMTDQSESIESFDLNLAIVSKFLRLKRERLRFIIGEDSKMRESSVMLIETDRRIFDFIIFSKCFFVERLVLKSLSSCFKLWISFKMQIKLLLGGAEEESRGLCLTSLLTKEAVSCILHGF